jgi:hypothetical protein
MTLRHLALVGLILSVMSTAARAEGFRCPRTDRLINEGDTADEVRSKCGDPSSQDAISGRRRQFDERWTYDFGPYDFTRILLFKRGRLIRVDLGGYGHTGNR